MTADTPASSDTDVNSPDLSQSKKAHGLRRLRLWLASPYLLLIYAFALGSIGAFAMQPAGYWPLLIAGLSGLYILLANIKGSALAFGLGWMFGFGYFLFSLSWIGNALLVENNDYRWAYPLALCGLPALLAFYTGCASLIARKADLKKLTGFFFFVGIFGLFEWLRGVLFTGFPWNLFGYSWAGTLEMAQLVSFIGIYGLSLLTIAAFALPGFITVNADKPPRVWVTGVMIFAALLAGYVFGDSRLANNPTRFDTSTRIVVVQPDIRQADKWQQNLLNKNYLTHLNVTRDAGRELSLNRAEKTPHTFVVWPESAITPRIFDSLQKPTLMSDVLESFGGDAYLISGIMRRDFDGRETVYYNSLLVLNERDEIPYVYDKHHLVPFGEYIPFSSVVNIAPLVQFIGLRSGPGPAIIAPDAAPAFMPLICYEGIFPNITMPLDNQDISWLVNVTNDAWYGVSAGPHQHLKQVSFRSIEQGLPLARSANTGISAIIDPYGRILEDIPYNTRGHISSYLPQSATSPTLYSQYGDIIFGLMIIFVCLPFLVNLIQRHGLKPPFPQLSKQ